MATPNEAPTTPIPSTTHPNNITLRNISLATMVLCPLLIALPPRKLDFYTVALVSGTFVSGNQLTHEYTGRSILRRIQDSATPSPRPAPLPIPTTQSKDIERARDSRVGIFGDKFETSDDKSKSAVGSDSKVLEEVSRRRAEEEKPAWKKERDAREKEAADEGRGYGDLITDQIWEVWSWGKGKAGMNKEGEEEQIGKGEGRR